MALNGTRLVMLLGGSLLALMAGVSAPLVVHADEAICAPLSTPVYQRVNPANGSNFITTSASESSAAVARGYTEDHGQLFAVSAKSGDSLLPVHQLYREKNSDYLWTASSGEVASATSGSKYVDQGVEFYVTSAEAGCGVAVHRYRNKGQHRLVVSAADRAKLDSAGWTYEGISFYAGNLSGAGAPAPAPPADTDLDTTFSIAVLPDTQQEVLGSGSRFKNRTDWLVANKAALDLRYVTHSGDVVNWDTDDHAQYVVASNALKPLEAAKIPYSLSIGNHDTQAVCTGGGACDPHQTRTLFRDTSTFNQYFTAARFGAVQGQFQAGKVDTEYSTFQAGGEKWMVLNLEMWPRDAALNWAKSAVASHADHNVIVVTHSYLDESGNISSDAGYGDNSPQDVFDGLIKAYPNIRLVFSGHVGQFADRVDTGVKGNKIHSFLQAIHDNNTNPVRLVTIDTKADTLKTWIYAPYTKKTYDGSQVNLTGVDWNP